MKLINLKFTYTNTMKLSIDMSQRYAKMRAHTATHLLHAELAKIFPDTKQAGSLVDEDLLRFDFYANNLLTQDQIQQIEKSVNQTIYEALPVDLIETSFEEWVKLWAKAFFEEKYWNEVRVIRVHDWDQNISVELCGWTHVNNTKEIWAFTIISQEAVASWIKRITAITWPKVIEKIHNYDEILSNETVLLDVKSYLQIIEKLQKNLKENADLQQRLESLETLSIRSSLLAASYTSNSDFSKIIQIENWTNFKTLQNIIKTVFPDEKTVLIFTSEWNYLIYTDGSISAKDLVKKYNLRGGWSDVLAQWKDESVTRILN